MYPETIRIMRQIEQQVKIDQCTAIFEDLNTLFLEIDRWSKQNFSKKRVDYTIC